MARSLAGVPLLGYFAQGSMEAVAIAVAAVLIVLTAAACFLIVKVGVAPVFEWGRLKLRFASLSGGDDDAGEEGGEGEDDEDGEGDEPPYP